MTVLMMRVMPQLRLALAQVNPCLGDLPGNTMMITAACRKASAAGAHLVVFGEMALTGYPVEDLAMRESFAAASVHAVNGLATRLAEDGCGELATVVGYLDCDTHGARNAVAVLYRGQVVARQFKHHLPNYGVFDERRYFISGTALTVFRLHGLEIGIVICEDIWQVGGPITALAQAGVDLVVAPQRFTLRARKGRHPSGAGGPPRHRSGCTTGLRQPGGSPGRAGLRR